MIPGASSTKESWNPRFIENLSENNTLIVIENKGDSIEQRAGNIKLNETVDVIGFSMGGITKSLNSWRAKIRIWVIRFHRITNFLLHSVTHVIIYTY